MPDMDIEQLMKQSDPRLGVHEICGLGETVRTLLLEVTQGSGNDQEASAAFHYVMWMARRRLSDPSTHPDARRLLLRELGKLNDRWKRTLKFLATRERRDD